ncbi:hypothetical protein SAMN06265222_1144 [Neorhodopirellula lusitana]|uniref:Uncharacterized protein n=1 Tax=Neorhodopirellula lusitana TaxID=445327 RepID=A0ABY1QKG6_9BACT|nr:hypothetical protein SAMN06265222_1144 [Neorhodopirellula lusitana]
MTQCSAVKQLPTKQTQSAVHQTNSNLLDCVLSIRHIGNARKRGPPRVPKVYPNKSDAAITTRLPQKSQLNPESWWDHKTGDISPLSTTSLTYSNNDVT